MPIQGDFTSEIPTDWLESATAVDKIANELLEWVLSGRTLDPDTNSRWMNAGTAHYCFWIPRFKTASAVKTNNEVGTYVNSKRLTTDKFVSAVAEREASFAVAKERFLRDFAEAQMLKCEQIVNTTKKNQEALLSEKSLTKNLGG